MLFVEVSGVLKVFVACTSDWWNRGVMMFMR
jgi:hypothetical protein